MTLRAGDYVRDGVVAISHDAGEYPAVYQFSSRQLAIDSRRSLINALP